MFRQVRHIQNFLRLIKGEHQPVIGPVKAFWDVLYNCNAKCRTCLRWQVEPDPQALSTEEGRRLIAELASSGVMHLSFSGGEPLLRRDIYDLIACAKEHKLTTSLVSNGLLINERRANHLTLCGLDAIYVSIDGSTPELNDSLRGIDGYLHLALEAMENLKSYRNNRCPKIFVIMTLNKANMYDIENVALLVKKMSLDGLSLQLAVASPAVMYEVAPELQLTKNDATALQAVIDRVVRLYGDYLTMDETYYRQMVGYITEPKRLHHPNNAAGFTFVTIDPRGNVYPDPFKTELMGNIRQESFEKIWFGKRASEIRESMASNGHAISGYDSYLPMKMALKDLTPLTFPRAVGPIFKAAEHC